MPVPASKLSGGQPQEVLLIGSDGYAADAAGHGVGAHGWGFDVAVTPTVTNGSYSANDIMGGLLTFANCARIADEPLIITGAQVACKADVNIAPMLVLFNADPSNTTKTDNAAYSLAAADGFKVIKVLTGFVRTDHGTPNTFSLDNIGLVAAPASSSRTIYGLLIDTTGVTLTSTSDVQVRLRGIGV